MPSPPSHDVIVIGVGTMGASAIAQLAERGHSVLGIERFDIAHTMGAHHGHSRMLRLSYFEHDDYVPLLVRSRRAWLELNERSGLEVFLETGALYMGPRQGELIDGSLGAARHHGLEHEELDADELRRRFGQFTLPESFAGLYESDAGLIVPELSIAAYAGAALRAGATIHGRERVTGWTRDGSGFVVTTDRDRYTCSRLVITAGAWAGPLVPTLERNLTVTRQVLAWIWPRSPDLFALGRCPCWAIEDATVTPGSPQGLLYGFPMMANNLGLKVARHRVADPADPDALNPDLTAADVAEYRPAVQLLLPEGDGPQLSHAVCMYSNTPDGHFIVGEVPGNPGVVIGCGFSGHGFKFAPVIGEALADLAIEGRTDLPIGFLSPTRFDTA